MRNAIIISVVMLCLANMCGALKTNLNQALIIDAGASSSVNLPPDKYTALRSFLEKSLFSVEKISVSSGSELGRELDRFLGTLGQGGYVFIYIKGQGAQQIGSSLASAGSNVLITTQLPYYDLQDMFAKLTTRTLNQMIRPIVVLDIIQGEVTGQNMMPLQAIETIPELMTVYSHQPGYTVKGGDTHDFIRKFVEVSNEVSSNKIQLDANQFFARVKREVSTSTQYRQNPEIRGYSKWVINAGGNIQQEGTWNKLINGVKEEPVAVGIAGAGIVGGLIYLGARALQPEPKKLPNPPGTPY